MMIEYGPALASMKKDWNHVQQLAIELTMTLTSRPPELPKIMTSKLNLDLEHRARTYSAAAQKATLMELQFSKISACSCKNMVLKESSLFALDLVQLLICL